MFCRLDSVNPFIIVRDHVSPTCLQLVKHDDTTLECGCQLRNNYSLMLHHMENLGGCYLYSPTFRVALGGGRSLSSVRDLFSTKELSGDFY